MKKFLDNNGAKDIGVKEKYGYTEEEFLKYVELLKEQYNKILNWIIICLLLIYVI